MDIEVSAALAESGALMLDVFAPFIEPLERELEQSRERRIGQAHGMVDFDTYHRRINAMNFALTHDDGQATNYDDADLVLVAVSRAGKTPTCVYLALHYGVRAANYPLTEEDLEHDRLPPRLRPYRNKLFGLTIDPTRLQQIRQERRPNSRYAQIETCRARGRRGRSDVPRRANRDAEHDQYLDRGDLEQGADHSGNPSRDVLKGLALGRRKTVARNAYRRPTAQGRQRCRSDAAACRIGPCRCPLPYAPLAFPASAGSAG